MSNAPQYKRRISGEEVKKGYIFVLKDKLDFFPAIGKSFELKSGTTTKQSRVETYRCTCRGPELPHDHYFIRWEGLRFGDKVTFEKDEKKENTYAISLGR